ncbi:hypothetical protein MK079_03790 [Candidatus Gracilibacteria bacterium]|nr:hypothetical protein [Candidatus Gracilibacteria bacterium]
MNFILGKKNDSITLSEGCLTGEAIYMSLVSGERDTELEKVLRILNKSDHNLNYSIEEIKEILFKTTHNREHQNIRIQLIENAFMKIFFPQEGKAKIHNIYKSAIIDFFKLCKHENPKYVKEHTRQHIHTILKNNPHIQIPYSRMSSQHEVLYILEYYYKNKEYRKIEDLVSEKPEKISWHIYLLLTRCIKDREKQIEFLSIPGIIESIEKEHKEKIIKNNNQNPDIIACFDIAHQTTSRIKHFIHTHVLLR